MVQPLVSKPLASKTYVKILQIYKNRKIEMKIIKKKVNTLPIYIQSTIRFKIL